MLRDLSNYDPERALKLHPADKKRIVRALEVYMTTGRTLTEHDKETKKAPPRFDASVFALCFSDRSLLYGRIDERVDDMMKRGLVDEVKGLLDSGVDDKCTAMQAIGYKETVLFLKGILSLEDAVSLIKQESRRYAKRQMTWLRRDPKVRWIFWEKYPDFDFARRKLTDFLLADGIK
jgi:tRNA dimethylallyltransferase